MPKEIKSEVLKIRLTSADMMALREQAEGLGLSISEYARSRILGEKIAIPMPVNDSLTVVNLRQIGGLIKQVFKADVVDPAETLAALRQLNKAVKAIEHHFEVQL